MAFRSHGIVHAPPSTSDQESSEEFETEESDQESSEELEESDLDSSEVMINVHSGYDHDWVEAPPDDLKCLICLCVARDPQQHPGDHSNDCGKIFCRECITESRKNSTKCPNCCKILGKALFRDTKSTYTHTYVTANDHYKWT